MYKMVLFKRAKGAGGSLVVKISHNGQSHRLD